MDWFSEAIGAGGIAGGIVATVLFVGKALINSLIKRSEKKAEQKVEFQSYKKKALFDRRFEVYSDIYAKMKELEGTIRTFKDVDWMATTKIDQAFYSKANMQYFESLTEEELRELKMIYDVNPGGRCVVNFNHFLELMSVRKTDLNNYVASEERILKDEESLLFAKLVKISEELIDKISITYNKIATEIEENEKINKNMCSTLVVRLDKQLDDFFEKDLERINDIIRDIDNKFREELHS
ncbi:hypothetical protein ACBR55_12115 [Salinicoccus roseus]|uniref:hypothetical protein n=1 Tax=Salinicoccus roseus TaxID=45670 RepID=UPI003526B41D